MSALPSLRSPGTSSVDVIAEGNWQVLAVAEAVPLLEAAVAALPVPVAQLRWDLSAVEGLDHVGAQFLWRAWGRQRPAALMLQPAHEGIFARVEAAAALALPPAQDSGLRFLDLLARVVHEVTDHLFGFLGLLGQFHLDLFEVLRAPRRAPWKEVSANVFHIGYQALAITALVGMLIGIVLSYLSSQQLRSFGGDAYLVNILGMSIIRELGPMLTAILVAGRSGSAITAQLGLMRVTEELDAMRVLGMPPGLRLVLPRVLALAVCMPLLIVWTDIMALAGGMLAARIDMGMPVSYFINRLPSAVPIANYWIGMGKGVVFGSLVALVACHIGMRIRPDSDSLGRGTTLSVVTSITIVIVADAIFAVMFQNVGYR